MTSSEPSEAGSQAETAPDEGQSPAARIGRRLFPRFTDSDVKPQRYVGIVGGSGTILVGIVNTIVLNYTEGLGLLSGVFSIYGGLILALGLISVACGFWDHPVARWTHVALFVFSGIFGAFTANRGNITSAFFIVFAIVLLVEYRFNRRLAWVLALMMLGGYLAALAVGYRDDTPYPLPAAVASLITVLTFIGLFGGVTLRHRLVLQRDAERLEQRVRQRTEALDRALRERTVMLKEIHHRSKNNMQSVSALLGMELDRNPGPDAERALTASRQRIQAMAGVHDALYRSGRLDQVELSGYIRNLVDTLLQTAIIPVQADLDIDEAGLVDLSLAASLGLVLNELVSNALKHGFRQSSTEATLRIQITRNPGAIRLAIGDNGSGLPEGFDLTRDAGVGLGVVTSIVGHRGGTIDHESNGGTRWVLELPVSGESAPESSA